MKDIIASMTLFSGKVEMLDRAIRSFLDTSLSVHIFLVDNSPTDFFRDKWKDDRITYIFNNKNLGFSGGQNIGLNKSLAAGAKYTLVLNPDIYFEKGVLETLFDFMEKNKETGLVLPKVLYPDGSIQYLYRLLPTPFDLFLRRFLPAPLRKLFKKQLDHYELIGMDLEKTHEIPFLSGCFMFIRSRVLKEVGTFDERFFLYMDDVDLSRRLLQKGKNIYYPGATIIHEHMRSSYKSLKSLKLHTKSAILYFNKWGWFFDKQRRTINEKTVKQCLK
ncbi:MAG: glycosyltransferase family 2 protein [bacterium]|nr:glycosyltransferase family 2 protein [bacterium]